MDEIEMTGTEHHIYGLLCGLLSNSGMDVDIRADTGLRNAGVSSASLIALLVQIEREFGFEWDDDVPSEMFHSISSLALHVDRQVVGREGL